MNLNLSFEFYPPQTPVGLTNLSACQRELIEGLSSLSALAHTKTKTVLPSPTPDFFSVTYGAGGTTREKTQSAITAARHDFPEVAVAPHLTCVGASKTEIAALIHRYRTEGINRLVVLRGDLPPGAMGRTSGDFRYASDLVAFIRAETGRHFHISVAAYPEMHPEAKSFADDVRHFVAKVSAGADMAISQFFFNPQAYSHFVDEVRAQGCLVPIVPGLMPINQFAQLTRFSAQCGAEIPRYIIKAMEGASEDEQRKLGINLVAEQWRILIHRGVSSAHFYTLNRSALSLAIIQQVIHSL